MNNMKTTTSVSDKKPNAWVVKTSDRGRKSIKKGNRVYLDDGESFEIEIFNPLKESVLADIKVNNSSVCKTGLVIRPGERFYLDCFIDDKKKFIFKTYEVEDTNESKESISYNGTIEVFFYKEEVFSLKNWNNKFRTVIERHYYPYHPYNYPYYNPYIYNGYTTLGGYSGSTLGGSAIGVCNTGGFGTTTGSITLNNSNTSLYTNISNVTFGTSGTSTLTSGTSFTNTSVNCGGIANANIETGRVEKGAKSDTKFSEIDMEFEKYHVSNVIYKLLPNSQKPTETKDLETTQKFCGECGRSNTEKNKFCPDCGNNLK